MRWTRFLIGAAMLSLLTTCAQTKPLSPPPDTTQMIIIEEASASSPSGELTLTLSTPNSVPHWQALWKGKAITAPAKLGIAFASVRDLDHGLSIVSVTKVTHDKTWEQPWGERRLIRDHHTELAADFAHADGQRAFTLRVRLFDDGLGLRYEVPADGERIITDELTEFRLPEDAQTWWIEAGGWNRYEYLYQETPLSEVHRAHTPLTAKLPGGPYISIHEAALTDYAGMWLNQRRPGVLQADLAPWSDGAKVKVNGSFTTPWRTLQISETAAGLANSNIILNLNEPNRLGSDLSWIKPSKYVGIWWCMHVNECSWGSGDKHGATTERTTQYIDFAAKHGLDGVLIEGWNHGWNGDWFANGEVFDFTAPYPDFDLEYLSNYAKERNVHLIGHHETSGAVTNYEEQMEAAYALYQKLGISAVKTGYVADGGQLTRRDANGKTYHEWHDGQYAVRHHLRALQTAAKYKISLNAHEPVKDTGLRRTYPNALSREGARGQEYNAWGQPPNDPAHTTILPFTRMLAGPMDFTPGIFDLSFGKDLSEETRVQTTLAKQLALYVILYSPIQMAADLPRNYDARPDAFQFIKDVPVDWENSITLDGHPGDFIVTVRQERGTNAWYLGAITDENARTVQIPLDFLDGFAYEVQIYRDGPNADWRINPYAFETAFQTVSQHDTLTLQLAPGGGTAIAFIPVE